MKCIKITVRGTSPRLAKKRKWAQVWEDKTYFWQRLNEQKLTLAPTCFKKYTVFIDDAYLGKRMKPLEEKRRFTKSQTAWIQTMVEFDFVRAILTSGQNPHCSMKPKKACFLSWKRGRAQKIKLNSLWGPFNSPPTGSPHMISSFPLDQEQRTWIWQSHLWRFQRLIGWWWSQALVGKASQVDSDVYT